MPANVKIWDAEAENGQALIEMSALKAKEAVANDSKRYSFQKPGDDPTEAQPAKRAEDVSIPTGWAGLPLPERRNLAINLGAARNATSEIVNAVIAAEVRRRAKASEPQPQPPQPPQPQLGDE